MNEIRVSFDDGTGVGLPLTEEMSELMLTSFLAEHGIPLNTRCGARGLCRGCEVEVCGKDGVPRLEQACRVSVCGIAEVSIPERSRLEHRPQVGDSFQIQISAAHRPLFESEGEGASYGVAIDLGTTTVVVLLVELSSGQVRSTVGDFNQQFRFGDNVLTRIEKAADPILRREMQGAVGEGSLRSLVTQACVDVGVSPCQLLGGVVSGNTTMLHLLAGVDPSSMGVSPFIPAFTAAMVKSGRELGVSDTEMPLQFLPGVSAFVGADIVAGIFATGMLYDQHPSLFVDVGTNGEIVLQKNGRLTACATAAGPAFEGAGLSCGTRARDTAVTHLELRVGPFALDAELIGGGSLRKASGICGSAYIDFLATGRSSGLLTTSGRFCSRRWEALPTANVLEVDGKRSLQLTDQKGEGKLAVSEADIAVLMQAKAAIGAGVEALLKHQELGAEDLGRVYLAGGFGMHLNVEHAIGIGLLPGIDKEQVEVVGNTSLAGALLALIDRGSLLEMEEIRGRTQIIELNLQDGFEDCYIDHLMLP